MYSVCFQSELNNQIEHLPIHYPYLITICKNNLRVYSECLELQFHLLLAHQIIEPNILLIDFQQIFRLEMMLVLDHDILRTYDMKNGYQIGHNCLGKGQFRNLQSIYNNNNCRFICFQSDR